MADGGIKVSAKGVDEKVVRMKVNTYLQSRKKDQVQEELLPDRPWWKRSQGGGLGFAGVPMTPGLLKQIGFVFATACMSFACSQSVAPTYMSDILVCGSMPVRYEIDLADWNRARGEPYVCLQFEEDAPFFSSKDSLQCVVMDAASDTVLYRTTVDATKVWNGTAELGFVGHASRIRVELSADVPVVLCVYMAGPYDVDALEQSQSRRYFGKLVIGGVGLFLIVVIVVLGGRRPKEQD